MEVSSDTMSALKRIRYVVFLAAAAWPAFGAAEILWSGDFEQGDFRNYPWRGATGSSEPSQLFWGVPEYGRPVRYSGEQQQVGDGSLLAIVSRDGHGIHEQGPVRAGNYAVRFVVRNSKSGSEPADCQGGQHCSIRRTQLWSDTAHRWEYDLLPPMSERWGSMSIFLPEDFEISGRGWGPVFNGYKPIPNTGSSGLFQVGMRNGGWSLHYRWSPEVNPPQPPWQMQMFADSTSSHDNPALIADLPDRAASEAALADLNLGGWTDWVWHIKHDPRGSEEGGTGFLRVWKRAGDGPWIEVLHVKPGWVERGGMRFDRGIGYNVPDRGFGMNYGPYMQREQVWDAPRDMVVYMDNIKIGSEKATFALMSPDGSTPDSPPLKGARRPKAPTLFRMP